MSLVSSHGEGGRPEELGTNLEAFIRGNAKPCAAVTHSLGLSHLPG